VSDDAFANPLILCLVVGGSAVLGASVVIVLPVGIVIAVVFLVGLVATTGRLTHDTLRKTPKAELPGPGGSHDLDSGG
jgi:hypothetical protein